VDVSHTIEDTTDRGLHAQKVPAEGGKKRHLYERKKEGSTFQLKEKKGRLLGVDVQTHPATKRWLGGKDKVGHALGRKKTHTTKPPPQKKGRKKDTTPHP